VPSVTQVSLFQAWLTEIFHGLAPPPGLTV